MDIKEKIAEIAEKIIANKDLLTSFQKDPVKAVESLIGVDLPDDAINAVVAGVKAKIAGDNAGNLMDSLKKLF